MAHIALALDVIAVCAVIGLVKSFGFLRWWRARRNR